MERRAERTTPSPEISPRWPARRREVRGQVPSIAADSGDRDHRYIPAQEDLELDPQASYFYYCANNTIYGTEWSYVPETGDVPLVCDMSSDILSMPVDVSRYGLIYAGAQKIWPPPV